jgi:uncharacterized membrane protein
MLIIPILIVLPMDPAPAERMIHAFFDERPAPDLVLCAAWITAAVACITVPVLNATPARIIFALPVVLFVPGYALIAALFPKKTDINLIERIALSFGLSIAVVPLIGLGLNYTPWGIRLDPIVVSLVLFTALMLLAAQYRRMSLLPDDRFCFPFRAAGAAARAELFPGTESNLDRALSIVLVIAVVAAIATTVYVIAVPKQGEKFTEFFILGPNKMAADYPSRIFAGTSYPMYIGVGNHEYRNITYTVEVWRVQMNFDPVTNTSSIAQRDLADRFALPVPDNQTVVVPYNLTFPKTGFNRAEFLLFNETVPSPATRDTDRINQSYQDLHLWVTVYPAGG